MIVRKYATYMQISLQESLVYRANAVVWMLVDSLPAYTMLLIWSAVYRGRATIANYSLGDMAAYYLAATFLGVALTPHPEYNLSYEIRNGLLSHQLIRPWNYFWALVGGETSWQVVKSSMNIPLFVLAIWVFRGFLHPPHLSVPQWGAFVIASVLAYTITTGVKIVLGSLAFWVVEPAGIIGVYDSLSWFLQGGVVPIDLFPAWLQVVGNAMPFQYTLAFPILILLNRLPAEALIPGLLWQLFWAVVMLGAALLIWRRGIQLYSAVGG